ncbi:3'-5' exonuclease [Candidatus Gracilibacteria bacterium]|nr:3'-5' exonuclease [Candidatus Gracilibacteria bacterium]
MKILVFDTETTGFINKKEFDLKKQPYIVQFAGILGELENGEYTELERINIFINPGIPIPYGASQVHHIYDIDVKDAPSMNTQIDTIMNFVNKADVLIGHNIEYDEDMLKLELKRYEKGYLYSPDYVLCTMKSTVDFCALLGKGERFKYPKLGELYKKLFGEYFIGAHDAMTDVEATQKCFLELEKQGILNLGNKKQEILSLF